MLEWLLTIGATELGKAVFEQGLKLGQTAAEDYVKDFFKGCLKEGVAAAKPEVAKKAVASALQAFLLLVTDELEDQELSKAQIRDRYDSALIQFVKNESVKPVLGSAFERDCGAIDNTTLATLWQQSTLRSKPFPAMPKGFDWQRIGSEYLKKVRRIVRETPDLRSLLETALLEDIARNTAHLNTQISPGFDVATYRDSLQTSYGYLKLSTIDTTDQQYRVKLWKMFIEQTVREALPPRQTTEVSEQETLEHDRREYFQQPSRKVLEAIASQIPDFSEKSGISQRAVILGDPGAGKSTLLQYLALEWVEGTLIPSPSPAGEGSQIHSPSPVGEVRADRLPLLIELREYAIAQTNNFLDFLHRGRGVDWQFDQQQLHHYLQEHPTLVMFDGLDEVFDRPTQAAIIDDIIRFAQQYPHAQILITSRIIGYNPERLQHAGFRHFTIQPLDTDEIHEFIDRWYTLALGNDPDKPRLVTRLKDAIANSSAIQNLADNPLLLTMMAILNRRQELPRDRADLYDQASRVLLYHWDVDHKKLNLPLDTIGRREKQEMLRLIAYDMQAGDEGLKGNLISADRLTRILTDYLRDQGFSEPREKANKLIDQLRHRNFILCDRGADTYGFVHRTFLEYFCAVEIVNRFEKQRTLTFDQLRDEVFGNHWQDEAWHEVLRLICGMVNPNFAVELIEFLMIRELDRSQSLDEELLHRTGERWLIVEDISYLLLAVDCLFEIGVYSNQIEDIREHLLTKLKRAVEHTVDEFKYDEKSSYTLTEEAARELLERICKYFPETLTWLQQCVEQSDYHVSEVALEIIIKYHRNKKEIFFWLTQLSENEVFLNRDFIENIIIHNYQADNRTLAWLQQCVQDSENAALREITLELIISYYHNNSMLCSWLKTCTKYNANPDVRETSGEALANFYRDDSEVFELLYSVVKEDPFIRQEDWENNPRRIFLESLCKYYFNHPKTLELLRDRAINDPDEHLREWAQEQLKMQNVELKKEDNFDG